MQEQHRSDDELYPDWLIRRQRSWVPTQPGGPSRSKGCIVTLATIEHHERTQVFGIECAGLKAVISNCNIMVRLYSKTRP